MTQKAPILSIESDLQRPAALCYVEGRVLSILAICFILELVMLYSLKLFKNALMPF